MLSIRKQQLKKCNRFSKEGINLLETKFKLKRKVVNRLGYLYAIMGYLYAICFLVLFVWVWKKNIVKRRRERENLRKWRKKFLLDFYKTINSLFAANLQFEGSYDFVLKRKVLLTPRTDTGGVATFFTEREGDSYLYIIEYVRRREFNRAKAGDTIHCGVVRHIEKEDVFFVVLEIEGESAIRKIVRRARLLFIAYLIAFLMVVFSLLTVVIAVLTITGYTFH